MLMAHETASNGGPVYQHFDLGRCTWCGSDPLEAALGVEGGHAAWCVNRIPCTCAYQRVLGTQIICRDSWCTCALHALQDALWGWRL